MPNRISFCLGSMEKLDLKDKKILYYLDLDSRQSFRSLGKKVGLSKDAVSNRVRNLEKSGIIFNYYSFIDAFKLDSIILRFYIKFESITSNIKEEIINCFIKNKFTNVVISTEGTYDLTVFFMIKDINIVYKFWENTLDKYRDYIENYNISLCFAEHLYDLRFLLENEKIENERTKLITSSIVKKVKLDELDYNILRFIASNARIPTLEIADKLRTTTSVIHYRIKKLTKLGIIKGYSTIIVLSKIGIKTFKCNITLKDYSTIHKIMRYIENNPNLVGRYFTLGCADIELTFYMQNMSEINNFIQDITNRFPGVVKSYNFSSHVKTHKYMYLPEELNK